MIHVISTKSAPKQVAQNSVTSTDSFYSEIRAEIEGLSWVDGCLVLKCERSLPGNIAGELKRHLPYGHEQLHTEWDSNSRHLLDYKTPSSEIEQVGFAQRFSSAYFQQCVAMDVPTAAVFMDFRENLDTWITACSIRDLWEATYFADVFEGLAKSSLRIMLFDSCNLYGSVVDTLARNHELESREEI